MKDKEVQFIKGKYTWSMKRRRTWGKQRWVLGIFKAEQVIAIVGIHPCVKRPVVITECCLTLEAIKFIEPYMDLRRFHECSMMHAAVERTLRTTAT